ncbi:MAG: hydrogenase maturation nickel metallochaperone HypA [bacterium]
MHESGIIEDLIHKIEDAARENGAKRIVSVDLAIGALAAIEPGHLREHFEVAARDTLAANAELRMTVSEDPLEPEAGSIRITGLEIET